MTARVTCPGRCGPSRHIVAARAKLLDRILRAESAVLVEIPRITDFLRTIFLLPKQKMNAQSTSCRTKELTHLSLRQYNMKCF